MSTISHIIPYISREFGGPVIAMAAMTNSLAALGESVSINAVHRRSEGQPVELTRNVVLNLHRDSSWGSLRRSASLWSSCKAGDFGVIHSHGMWTDVHRCAALAAREKGIPHVIGPCGMLDQAALQRSKWKKKLVGTWFQYKALREANCLLANSEKEYQDIRKFGLKNPVAIIPNPVNGPKPGINFSQKNIKPHRLFSTDRKTVFFLGRIHPVKGLERLVGAWARLKIFHQDWQLVIAGPDEGGYRSTIEMLILASGCESSVRMIGVLNDAEKWVALQSIDLFIMPSDFENFGISIAEALLAKKPVITTNHTPWQSLALRDAGWWVERTEEALEFALAEAMNLDDSQREAMGRRGCEIAISFSPERVANQLRLLYRWLQSSDEMPDFVRMN